ncbi:MAG: hypothetical protein DI527_12150 [Chelatococcus sp.]|nr:MAG: hypothetical protein DI527_12150 [Chelatococcus sp.]
MSREQIVRDAAYAIWEAEGRPEGREAEHWRIAEAQVAALIEAAPNGRAGSPAKAKVAKGSGAAKAPAKPAAARAPSKKKT